jgi:hypothetical protein
LSRVTHLRNAYCPSLFFSQRLVFCRGEFHKWPAAVSLSLQSIKAAGGGDLIGCRVRRHVARSAPFNLVGKMKKKRSTAWVPDGNYVFSRASVVALGLVSHSSSCLLFWRYRLSVCFTEVLTRCAKYLKGLRVWLLVVALLLSLCLPTLRFKARRLSSNLSDQAKP